MMEKKKFQTNKEGLQEQTKLNKLIFKFKKPSLSKFQPAQCLILSCS